MCTEECGRPTPPGEQELIEAFGTAAQQALAFLGTEHGLRPTELATFAVDGAGHIPVAISEAAYPFLAMVEYTGATRPIRLSYGRREYELDLEIGANGSGFHPLASWFDALDIEHAAGDDSGVATPEALTRHTERLAGALREHFPSIAAAGQDVVDRLPSLGAKTAPRLNRTREKAHSAFADGDYTSYIELLAPFEGALTVTERRKLEFARARS
jgi:hypothetical protein